jgi:hypothetical protein
LLRIYNTIGAGPSKPSWVVDWGDSQHITLGIDTVESPFCASGNPTADACIEGGELSVNGLLVEKVAIIAKSCVLGYHQELGGKDDPVRELVLEQCKLYEEIEDTETTPEFFQRTKRIFSNISASSSA